MTKGPIVHYHIGTTDAATYPALFSVIQGDDHELTLLKIPPPQLHLHVGVVDLTMNAIIAIWGLENVLEWCKENGVMRRGYQGGTFDGNNAKKILERTENLADCVPVKCLPLVDLLQAFKPIVSGVFGDELRPDFEELIHNFRECFIATQRYLSENVPEVRINVTWKVHILIIHVPQFLLHFRCGMSRFSEQTGESVHHAMKLILARYSVNEDHPLHGERLKKTVVEFSTERV